MKTKDMKSKIIFNHCLEIYRTKRLAHEIFFGCRSGEFDETVAIFKKNLNDSFSEENKDSLLE
jgi:hypothetical protein